ncbi:MAG: endo-1,4-beta-xylanase [Spirochaetales bacterium]|nr:endo-1,4-beta-xylanase [Spirochaetales bacterium]
MNKYVSIIVILLILLFGLLSCPKPDSIPGDESPSIHLSFTFEADTDIETWIIGEAVDVLAEGGTTDGTCETSTEQAKTGTQSLKIMGALGTEEYSSQKVVIKLDDTLDLSPQDFSRVVMTVSVFVPAPPEGGGDYIQVTLQNSAGDNVQSSAFSITYDTWNDIIFDVDTYITGTETWGYDSTGGSPEQVYTAVTGIGAKVGFSTGPGRDYYYYIDDLNAEAKSLRAYATARGIYIGAAVNPDHFNETNYNTTLKEEFNMMVAENAMKMGPIHPSENTYSWNGGDAIISLAETNNMEVRGHALLWHNQVPDWMKAKNYSELETVLQSHIDTVVTHYKGKIHSWDVVNEIIKDDGTGLRNNNETPDSSGYSIWADTPTDDSLIIEAFNRAHTVDPDALLIINDYSNETMGQTKADALYNLIDGWVGEGVPIDGVGFQLHLLEEYNPDYTNIRANIDRYVALGLEVHFTEIDVRISGTVTQTKLDHQALIYANLMQIALDYPEVTCFVTWGVSDKYSWIPDFFEGYDKALLFDENYFPKPAYYELIDVLD